MTPDERAEFLSWLNRLELDQLREVVSHVNAVITFKRGAVLRYLAPGSQIVYDEWKNGEHTRKIGTVVKLHRVSVTVELADGQRETVGVDMIQGQHIGRGESVPLGTVQDHQPSTEEAEFCTWCGKPGEPSNPLLLTSVGEMMHEPCWESYSSPAPDYESEDPEAS